MIAKKPSHAGGSVTSADTASPPGILVIAPCGQKKIWNKRPDAGPTAARDCYAGSPFIVNRSFAEHFGDRWLVLSANYGFIGSDFELPGPYNVTFKRKGVAQSR